MKRHQQPKRHLRTDRQHAPNPEDLVPPVPELGRFFVVSKALKHGGFERCYERLDPIHPNGYKYRTTTEVVHALRFFEPGLNVSIGPWVSLEENILRIHKDYMWDGATGPAIDTEDFMPGSLAHDAGYQLMGHGLLPLDPWKRHFDRELVRICGWAGMPAWRRAYVYPAVRFGGSGRDRYRPAGL